MRIALCHVVVQAQSPRALSNCPHGAEPADHLVQALPHRRFSEACVGGVAGGEAVQRQAAFPLEEQRLTPGIAIAKPLAGKLLAGDLLRAWGAPILAANCSGVAFSRVMPASRADPPSGNI